MTEKELKQIVGGMSATLINALTRAADVVLSIGQIVGTALRKLIIK